jgi:hypothetical protein
MLVRVFMVPVKYFLCTIMRPLRTELFHHLCYGSVVFTDLGVKSFPIPAL